MPVVGWSEGLGRPLVVQPGQLPIVSAEEVVRRVDRDGDGLVSPAEKQYALDHFAPGKELDHHVASQRLKAAETALEGAKKDVDSKVATAQAWNTTGNVGMVGTAAASLGIFLATKIPFLAAIPVVNVIALIIAGLFGLLALIAKIGQVVAETKADKAKIAQEEARTNHDRSWQELGATLEKKAQTIAPDVAPRTSAPPAPIAMRGVSLRRVA